jgi:uncharacterized membrane protein YtjA (UPF0391 family)
VPQASARISLQHVPVKPFHRLGFCRQILPISRTQELKMLHYSVVFLVIALIAAVFGFGAIAAGAVEIAKILFFIFAAIAIVGFVVSFINKR